MAGRRKADEQAVLEAPEDGGRLSVADQFHRNVKVCREKARGDLWPVIAERHGISISRCKQIHAEWRATNPTLRHQNPVEIVDALLEGYMADLQDLNVVYDEADSGQMAAKVGAVNARRQVREKITELLQAVGALPNDLGTLRIELDAQVVYGKVIALMERYKVPEAALDELLEELGGAPPGYELDAGDPVPVG